MKHYYNEIVIIFQIRSYFKEEHQTTKYFVSAFGRQKYFLTAFWREAPLWLFSLFPAQVSQSLPQSPWTVCAPHSTRRGWQFGVTAGPQELEHSAVMLHPLLATNTVLPAGARPGPSKTRQRGHDPQPAAPEVTVIPLFAVPPFPKEQHHAAREPPAAQAQIYAELNSEAQILRSGSAKRQSVNIWAALNASSSSNCRLGSLLPHRPPRQHSPCAARTAYGALEQELKQLDFYSTFIWILCHLRDATKQRHARRKRCWAGAGAAVSRWHQGLTCSTQAAASQMF